MPKTGREEEEEGDRGRRRPRRRGSYARGNVLLSGRVGEQNSLGKVGRRLVEEESPCCIDLLTPHTKTPEKLATSLNLGPSRLTCFTFLPSSVNAVGVMTASTATPATVPPMARPGSKRERQNHLHQGQSDAVGCGGEGCAAWDPWPLHNVRHRGSLCRLCTSCVLRCHPGSFCPSCLELFDGRGAGGGPPQEQSSAVVHCVRCPSVCHADCLPDAEKAAEYVCPSCANPNGFSYLPVGRDRDVGLSDSPRKKARAVDGDGGEEEPQMDRHGRMINRKSAKLLLAAAQLASASMKRAVALARSEAERKAKDAVVAKKRAKEMLDKALIAAKRETERRRQEGLMRELQRKTDVKSNSTMGRQKRAQKAEQERRLSNPVPLAHKSPAQAIVENGRLKGSFLGHLNSSSVLNSVMRDESGKGGSFPDSKGSFSTERERVAAKVPAEPGESIGVTPSKQDASVITSNLRATFTSLPRRRSLHS